MSITRRDLLGAASLISGGLGLLRASRADAQATSTQAATKLPYIPVVMPNGATLPWTMKDGVKEFHLTAEVIKHEVAPGMVITAWGYNGRTPGPMIEAVEGDRVRFFVHNKLPERTSVHWHGILLPNGMDGVAGLNQPHIEPGETYVYEFTLRQHGVNMYHPHSDEMTEMAMGSPVDGTRSDTKLRCSLPQNDSL